MTYDFRKMTEKEVDVFVELREKYSDYCAADFLMHKTLKILGVTREEFNNR